MNDTTHSEPAPVGQAATEGQSPATPAHRSRWRRFSPSMGWPVFWSEILIVVLGVVIALAANEAVQEWTWRSKVQDAESRLKQESRLLFAWHAEVVVTQPCVEAQLEALGRRLLASGALLQPAPIHRTKEGTRFVARVPGRPYVFGTWEALGADGTATHFARDRQQQINRIASGASQAQDWQWERQRLLGRLQLMRDAIPLDAGVRAALLTDIHQSRLLGAQMAVSARQQMSGIAEAFGSPDELRTDAFLGGVPDPQGLVDVSATVAFCKQQGFPLADWRPEEKQ